MPYFLISCLVIDVGMVGINQLVFTEYIYGILMGSSRKQDESAYEQKLIIWLVSDGEH